MKRIVLGVIGGAALGFAIAFAINEFIFAGPEYGDALLWAVVGAIVGGFMRAWSKDTER
jgi:hypothetical protein